MWCERCDVVERREAMMRFEKGGVWVVTALWAMQNGAQCYSQAMQLVGWQRAMRVTAQHTLVFEGREAQRV